MRRLSAWFLEWAERLFLHTNGWDPHHDVGGWTPPDDYKFRRHDFYHRGHAVNAQKQLTYNTKYGGIRKDQT